MSALPITVPHTLQAPAYEVIPAAMVSRMEASLAVASSLTAVDESNVEAAKVALVGLHTLGKDLAKHVATIKGPLNQFLDAVRDCAKRAEAPVENAKGRLQRLIATYDNVIKAREAAEAARVAEERRQAQEKADAENRRLRAEAQAAADLKAKELEDLIGTPVEAKAEPIAEVKPVEVATARIVKPSEPSPVVTRQVPTLEIYDPKALAAAYCIGGEVLVDFRNAVVMRVLNAGLDVPGARIVMKETTAMRAVRS